MNASELQTLENELMDYTMQVGEGKHFEILSVEIRRRIDVLNERIDNELDIEGSDDMQILTFVCYQYY